MPITNLTTSDLEEFEERIASEFNRGKIPFPVHLEQGNESALLDIFESVEEQDWIFGSWRLHSKALLKGVPPDDLRAAIFRGESMRLRFPGYRVYGSSIVGGNLPIALGVAMAIKRRDGGERVWCFMGDMTALSGIAHECFCYSGNHELPITWICEDNGLSVCTPTVDVWRAYHPHDLRVFRYESKWPHAGAGKRIEF